MCSQGRLVRRRAVADLPGRQIGRLPSVSRRQPSRSTSGVFLPWRSGSQRTRNAPAPSMASTEGLVPITRSFLARYYDRYEFVPLHDDVQRLSAELREGSRVLIDEAQPTPGMIPLFPSLTFPVVIVLFVYSHCPSLLRLLLFATSLLANWSRDEMDEYPHSHYLENQLLA